MECSAILFQAGDKDVTAWLWEGIAIANRDGHCGCCVPHAATPQRRHGANRARVSDASRRACARCM